jgi:hypothetical protein
MKKSLLKFLPLAVAVMLATSCSKDENNNSENTPETTEVVNKKGIVQIPFSVGIANAKSLSKVAFSENGATINFENDDVENVKLTVTGEGVSGDLNLVNENGYKFSGTLSVEADKETAFTTDGIDLQGTFTQNKGDQTSNTNFEELLNNCAHTYNTTFKSNDESLELIDQNFYVYVERAKDGINIGGQTSFEQGKYYVFPIGTTVDGKDVAPAKLYTIGKAVSSVTLDKTTVSVNVNATETLTATVTPSDATNSTVEWTSSDESVATVSNGVVTGKKGGTATITATADGVSATCTVTVVQKPTSVTINGVPTTTKVWGNNAFTLTASVEPSGVTNPTVSWKVTQGSATLTPSGVNNSSCSVLIKGNSADLKIKATVDGVDSDPVTITIDKNYVDLGTGAVYWKTSDESGTYTFAQAKSKGAPEKEVFDLLWTSSNVSVSGYTFTNTNGSGASITFQNDWYWSYTENTTDNGWLVAVNSGRRTWRDYRKSYKCRVRLVRAQ